MEAALWSFQRGSARAASDYIGATHASPALIRPPIRAA